jgi:hypothetical protein
MAMSDASILPVAAQPEDGPGVFNGRVMLWVIAAAIISFVGFLFLSAYAPEMKQGQDGRAHALSKSAVGYAGIVALRDNLGRKPKLVRDDKGLETYNVLVVMPELTTDAEALRKLVEARGERVTLIVLPKRNVVPDFTHAGWVQGRAVAEPDQIESVIKKLFNLEIVQRRLTEEARFTSDWAPEIRFGEGAVVNTIDGTGLESYISDDEGRILLGGIKPDDVDGEERYPSVYILSDADVLNNLGVGNAQMANAANAMLDGLADEKTKAVDFDVTLNGFGRSPGLLKLAFEPPFLALSVCLFLAALMALFNGLMRFGPPLREAPVIAPGKGALVANTADLLRLAGLEHEAGARYAALARDSAAHDLGLPPAMSADAVTERLDRVSHQGPPFSQLMADAENASHRDDMLAAARALYKWRKEKTG